jgi:4-aminobutyrate aminotransferase
MLLIADEVQTGFGRTGKMFAMEHHTVQADIITMAKSLAGGMPLSGLCGRAEVMDAPAPGGLGGTYAGNPLAVAAAHAVLDTLEAESLLERAQLLGAQLREFLQTQQAGTPAMAEVRGLGAMNAVEFVDPVTGKPSAEITQSVQQAALKRGLLLLSCGVYGNVIRFLHPLTIPQAQFDDALVSLGQAIQEATHSCP